MAVIKRYEGNPILTKDDVPYEVATIHNAGAIKFGDKYILLFRSHLLNGRSIIGLAESDDGFTFKVREEPFMIHHQIHILHLHMTSQTYIHSRVAGERVMLGGGEPHLAQVNVNVIQASQLACLYLIPTMLPYQIAFAILQLHLKNQ
jgi:hypothetical protein